MAGKNIVITVFGSLGDLHPLLALGLGLKARGHTVTIATSRYYQEKVEREGLRFAPLRPEQGEYDDAVFDELFDRFKGPERLIRKYLLPYVRESYEDLLPLMQEADFLINSPTIYAGPLVAEYLQKPWASVALQPFLIFSAYDPPVLAQLPSSEGWRGFGLWFWKGFLRILKSTATSWPKPVYELRTALGLPDRGNPLFEGQFSPYLNLALFSKYFAEAQVDWPAYTAPSGFLFYDGSSAIDAVLPEAVTRFLGAGAPPVLFTLGSSVVNTTTSFYKTSIQAVRALKCRAIFLAGDRPAPDDLDDTMLWWDALPYSLIFPHVAVIVHQGGAGTSAQALRAGKPTLIVPHGFDQPDNAARLKRLGLSLTLHPEHYTAPRVVKCLQAFLTEPKYSHQAQAMRQNLAQEDGLRAACELIEAVIS